ncbi:MAG: DUF5996 family protein [Pseudomonadota bacterium]
MTDNANWPDIPYARWAPTGASLHMWLQIVGKFRLSLTPWINHSWQATYYVTARGLSSGLIPSAGASYEATFDFLDHTLTLTASDGRRAAIGLYERSVADFDDAFRQALRRLGAPADFHHAPNEVPDAIPFAKQTEVGAYDAAAVSDFFRALLSVDAVFKRFRTGFLGKVSPVHFFWGSFDLAVTRFSGRSAPLHPGGFPALPDAITREAYSHEVSSAGFWPGGGGIDEAAFYSYAYPSPEGFANAYKGPAEGYFYEPLGEFVLPYAAVRKAAHPEALLLDFLQATYAAAAQTADWNQAALNCAIGAPGVPRVL